MSKENKEVKAPVKQNAMTIVKAWFDNNANDSREDLIKICDVTARAVQEQFGIYIKSGNHEVFACVFSTTFKSILKFIASKEEYYDEFTIQICNSLNIGFAKNTTESNEDDGGFMPFIEHIGLTRRIIDSSSDTDPNKTDQNLLRWKELNIKKNIEYYLNIQEDAYNTLKTDFLTDLRTSEAIIPLFSIFMDNIINVLKLKWDEAAGMDISRVSITVLGLFTIYYSYDDVDDVEMIDIVPNATTKLRLKSDNKASKNN